MPGSTSPGSPVPALPPGFGGGTVPVPPMPPPIFIPSPITNYTSWDSSTENGVAIFSNNLRATNLFGLSPGISGGPVIGAGVSIPTSLAQVPFSGRDTKFFGRFYFEVDYAKRTDLTNGFPATFNGGIAVAPFAQSNNSANYTGLAALYAGLAVDYFGFGANASLGTVCSGSGAITKDGLGVCSLPVDPNVGSLQEGDVIGVAVDVNSAAIWFRCVFGPSSDFNTGSDWNGGSSAGGIGAGYSPNNGSLAVGLTIGNGVVPMAIFGGETKPQSVILRANFGFDSFFGHVPIGPSGAYNFWPFRAG